MCYPFRNNLHQMYIFLLHWHCTLSSLAGIFLAALDQWGQHTFVRCEGARSIQKCVCTFDQSLCNRLGWEESRTDRTNIFLPGADHHHEDDISKLVGGSIFPAFAVSNGLLWVCTGLGSQPLHWCQHWRQCPRSCCYKWAMHIWSMPGLAKTSSLQ